MNEDFGDPNLEADPTSIPEGEPNSGTGEPSAFYDASQVPEELQPTFREMQKAFTQKTQQVAEDRKALGEAGYKAQLLDQLLANDQVTEFLRSLRSGSPPSGGSKGALPAGSDVASIVRAELARHLGPIDEQNRHLAVRLEKQEFEARYPEYTKVRDIMSEGFKRQQHNGNFTMEDAYFWARGKAAIEADRRGSVQASRASRAVEQNGTSRPASQGQKINGFWDAVNAALEEGGLDRKRFYNNQE